MQVKTGIQCCAVGRTLPLMYDTKTGSFDAGRLSSPAYTREKNIPDGKSADGVENAK